MDMYDLFDLEDLSEAELRGLEAALEAIEKTPQWAIELLDCVRWTLSQFEGE